MSSRSRNHDDDDKHPRKRSRRAGPKEIEGGNASKKKLIVRFGDKSQVQDQQSVEDDIKQTKADLERLEQEKKTLVITKHYKEWSDNRKATIEEIDKFQKWLNQVYVGSNVAQLGAASAGALGLGFSMYGSHVEKDKESADNLKQVGDLLVGAAATVTISSKLIEAGLSESAINKIKSALEKDVEVTEPLKKWLKVSKEMYDRLNRLFQSEITSSTFTDVIKACRLWVELLDEGKAEFQDLISLPEIRNMKSFEVIQKVFNSLIEVLKKPSLRQTLLEICKFFEVKPHIFEFAELGIAIYNTTCGALGTGSLTTMLSAADQGFVFPVRSALDTISFVSKFVTIILAIKNVYEAKSKYSDSLDQIKKALQMELEEIESKRNNM